MSFFDLLLNLLLPIVVAGVISYWLTRPDAPMKPEAKSLVSWIVWGVCLLWILVWVLRIAGVIHMDTVRVPR